MEFEMMVNNDEEQQLLFAHLNKKMRVLEFGSGASTLAIAKRVKRVVSIEHDETFYKSTLQLLKDNGIVNVGLFYVPANALPIGADDGTAEGFADYINTPAKYAVNEKFDLVFVDGRARVACAKKSIESYLKTGGIIFIHDYGHPNEQYRRPEYEVVEEFLKLKKKEFTMAMFTDKKIVADGTQKLPDGVVVWDENNEHETHSVLSLEKNPDNPGHILSVHTDIPVPANVKTLSEEMRQEIFGGITFPENNPGFEEITALAAPENGISVDESSCWYNDYCVTEMNRFYDIHLKNQDLRKHLIAFTTMLGIINIPGERIIDLGCGTAMLSEFCKEYEYIGADLAHIITGCAKRNYPEFTYRDCDLVKDSLDFVFGFKIVVVNGVIDIMEHPLEIFSKVLKASTKYVIVHRQEITEAGQTHTIKNGSYGGFTYHSIISRADWVRVIEENGFKIKAEMQLEFGNWENGGCSFLLEK